MFQLLLILPSFNRLCCSEQVQQVWQMQTCFQHHVLRPSRDQHPTATTAPEQGLPTVSPTLLSLLGHTQVLSLLLQAMCPSVHPPQLSIPHLFIIWPVVAWEKATQRAENDKTSGFILHFSHLNSAVVWLPFSFLGERLMLFKLASNRSHKFHSGDSKPSFYVKLLFVKEKDFIILELAILCP